jgi:hypothetical protein
MLKIDYLFKLGLILVEDVEQKLQKPRECKDRSQQIPTNVKNQELKKTGCRTMG